ncbi:uncharacterized protein K460DRAFT_80187 [Cucurbitaria berberidis CBS 394.84]|uniref:Uncharacterized protein n=1 Tax=Cucurbitaria berberidis CBS 394.84 TaxID=1168544 RepID=A0A9P4LBM6_9PLEO|nr:uncharacterized protein K460DRAFT_80187 [Cucurbitaria berberidis CBS 394.84]KAF1848723.1 hypothetical protein K460DRAFT_80187 [Cucurbitaria berberidis CBS 394.84]
MSFPLNYADVQPLAQAAQGEQQTRSNQELIFDTRKQLQDLSKAQEKLAKARERVLIQRENVRASAQKIREKRVIAGDAEAVFMNSVRQYANQNNGNVLAIVTDHTHVEMARNELGVLEADHLQAEGALTGAEWNFMVMENEFYQFDIQELISQMIDLQPPSTATANPLHMPPPPPPPPPPNFIPSFQPFSPQYPLPPPPSHPPTLSSPTYDQLPSINRDHDAAVAELDELRKEFDILRHEQARRIDARSGGILSKDGETLEDASPSDFEAVYFDVLGRMAHREVDAQRLKEDLVQHELEASAIRRRNSDSYDIQKQIPFTSYPMTRALTESAIPILSGDPSVRQRIQDWLLKDLKENAVYRNLYLNTLHSVGIQAENDGLLEDWAARNWGADSSGAHMQDEIEDIPTETRPAGYIDNLECGRVLETYIFGRTEGCDDGTHAITEEPCYIPLPLSSKTTSEDATETEDHNATPLIVGSAVSDLHVSTDDKFAAELSKFRPETFEISSHPQSAIRKDSHHGYDTIDCQLPDASNYDEYHNLDKDRVHPRDIPRGPETYDGAEIPTITVTEPQKIPFIENAHLETRETPPQTAVFMSARHSTQVKNTGTDFEPACIHEIRVNVTPVIPRSISLRSERSRSSRTRVRELLFKKRQRSQSTGATLGANDTMYTWEHRRRDVQLGEAFRGL